MIRFLSTYFLWRFTNKLLICFKNILSTANNILPTRPNECPPERVIWAGSVVRDAYCLLTIATFTYIKVLIILFLFPFFKATAQCPDANFNLSDTVCQGQPIPLLQNTTTGNATSYEWDFCAGDLLELPNVTSLINSANSSYQFGGGCWPSGIKMVQDNNGKWYGFFADYICSKIYQLYFDSIYDNTPTPLLVNVSQLYRPFDMDFYQENNKWYALVVNIGDNKLLRLKFPTTLSSPPQTDDLTDFGLISKPRGISIVHDEATDSLFVFISNDDYDSITVVSFGNSILNPPVAYNIGLNNPLYRYNYSTRLIKDCNQWYGFVCSMGANAILRLDFGTSLSNPNPSIINLGNFGVLNGPLDIYITKEGKNWLGFVTNYYGGDFVRVNFGQNITNIPQSIIIGNTGDCPIHVDFTKVGSRYSAWLLLNCSSNLKRLDFPDSCGTTTPIFTQENPSPVIYDIPYDTVGEYYVSLYTYDDNGNFDCYQDSITVLPALYVDFSATNNPICSDTFIFTSNIQTPEITNTYLWDFGDGDTSNLANPMHIYQYPGTYQVTLTCSSSVWSCPGTATHTVENNKAYPDFYVDTGFVVPPLQFTDLTPDPNHAIDSWFWDFGDSTTSTLQNPTHTYASGGFFDVMLIVTINNCQDTVIKTIPYTPKPNIQFTVTDNCDGDTTWFNNSTEFQTVTDYIETYIWNYDYPLGDYDTIPSDSLTTFYVYPDTGNQIIMLQVISHTGLKDTLIDTIRIYPMPIPNFSVPALVCEDASIQFFDSSFVPGPDTTSSWIWDFGDGDSDTMQNPTHIYQDTGTYCVTLTVFSGPDCGADTTKCLTVTESPKAGFIFDHTCMDSIIQFIDTSITPLGTTINLWIWNFGDGWTSTQQHPTFTYSNDSTFIITLTITNNAGCSGFTSDTFTVSPLPVVDFIPLLGCNNSVVSFFDNSTIETGSIVSWFWNFGDITSGTNNYSSLQNPSHLFDSVASYNVKLITTSDKGCKDSIIQTVQIIQAPVADFIYLSDFAGNTFSFSDITPPTIINWYWDFGDGESSILQNPTHTYYTDSLSYQVTLIVQSVNGCYDTITKTIQILHKEIVADFIGDDLCANTPYQFFDNSHCINCSTVLWNWNFNNQGSSIEQNPFFTFEGAGTYSVTLEVQSQEGQPATITKTITVHENPVADFTFEPSYGAPPLQVSFTCDTTLVDSAIWDFGDGYFDTINNYPFTTSHVYTDSGIYNITLYVFTEYGCSDTLTEEIKIMTPILDVAVNEVLYDLQTNKLSIATDLLNIGTRNIDSLLLYVEVEGGSTIIEKWYGPLYSSQNTLYNFVASFSISEDESPSYICVHALFENPQDIDSNPLNNHQCKSLNDEFIVIPPYPNPANNALTIEYILPFSDNVEISIFNSIGQKVYNYSYIGNTGLNILYVNMAGFAKGIYIEQIIFNEESVVKRFMRY